MNMYQIIGTDIDGVISSSPVHFGARSRFLCGVWAVLDAIGVSRFIMWRMRPRPWVVEWLQAMSKAGNPIWVITQRGCKHREFTQRQLTRWNVPYSYVFCFPGDVDPVEWKAKYARLCNIMLEDQQGLIDGMQAQLGNQAPVFYNTTRDADLMQARLESEKGTDHVETV